MKSDQIQGFLFENLSIRGQIVHLDQSWKDLMSNSNYPTIIEDQLAQVVLASILMASSLKNRGSIVIQIQGDGPIRTLVVQAHHAGTFRGMVHFNENLSSDCFKDLFRDAKLVLTVQHEGSIVYQGVVPIEGDSIGQALESYFARSEQLPTKFVLTRGQGGASGLLLQSLPKAYVDQEDWSRINLLTETLTQDELLHLDNETILYRLFNEEKVKLFEPKEIAFSCGCSQSKVAGVLVALGEKEVSEVIEEEGQVTVFCDFCNKRYVFDPIDVKHLFSNQIKAPPPSLKQ
jgi:molecular chaperone Hsp33